MILQIIKVNKYTRYNKELSNRLKTITAKNIRKGKKPQLSLRISDESERKMMPC